MSSKDTSIFDKMSTTEIIDWMLKNLTPEQIKLCLPDAPPPPCPPLGASVVAAPAPAPAPAPATSPGAGGSGTLPEESLFAKVKQTCKNKRYIIDEVVQKGGEFFINSYYFDPNKGWEYNETPAAEFIEKECKGESLNWKETDLNNAISEAFKRDVATYFPREKREEKIDRLIELVLAQDEFKLTINELLLAQDEFKLTVIKSFIKQAIKIQKDNEFLNGILKNIPILFTEVVMDESPSNPIISYLQFEYTNRPIVTTQTVKSQNLQSRIDEIKAGDLSNIEKISLEGYNKLIEDNVDPRTKELIKQHYASSPSTNGNYFIDTTKTAGKDLEI